MSIDSIMRETTKKTTKNDEKNNEKQRKNDEAARKTKNTQQEKFAEPKKFPALRAGPMYRTKRIVSQGRRPWAPIFK